MSQPNPWDTLMIGLTRRLIGHVPKKHQAWVLAALLLGLIVARFVLHWM